MGSWSLAGRRCQHPHLVAAMKGPDVPLAEKRALQGKEHQEAAAGGGMRSCTEPQAPLCSDWAGAGSSSSAERDGLCGHSPVLSPSVHDTAGTPAGSWILPCCEHQRNWGYRGLCTRWSGARLASPRSWKLSRADFPPSSICSDC